MLRKHESPALRLLVTLIHLALFAELGVLTRTFLDKFFTLGCSGGWGPCLQDGVYFKDLPSNMLGSFIIGLAAASSTLGLATDKAMAALPRGHPWQSNLELQIGVRTGYCGSLTTFASWQLELITLAVQQNRWVDAALGFITGLFAAIVCYVLGMHAALAIDRWVVGERYVLEEMELYRESQLAFIEGLRPDQAETSAQKLMEQAEPDIPRLMSSHTVEKAAAGLELSRRHMLSNNGGMAAAAAGMAGGDRQLEGLAEEDGEEEEVYGEGIGLAAGEPDWETRSEASAAKMLARLSVKEQLRQQQQQRQEQQQMAAKQGEEQQQGEASVPDGTQAPSKAPAQHAEQLTPRSFVSSLRGYRTDGAALLALALCTAALAVGVGLERRHSWLRTSWLACLLGPPGCILRWYLSRFNYKLQGRWDWFPAGTFAANMAGTAIDFALQCVLQRRAAAIGYWGNVLIGSVMTGFCGSLTTVSTFVTEVVKFSEAVPSNFRAYTYALVSLGGGIVLGLVLYGWSVWAD